MPWAHKAPFNLKAFGTSCSLHSKYSPLHSHITTWPISLPLFIRSLLKCHFHREAFPDSPSNPPPTFILCLLTLFYFLRHLPIPNLYNYLFTVCLPSSPLEHEFHEGSNTSPESKQCLSHSECSRKMLWMSKWISLCDKKKLGLWELGSLTSSHRWTYWLQGAIMRLTSASLTPLVFKFSLLPDLHIVGSFQKSPLGSFYLKVAPHSQSPTMLLYFTLFITLTTLWHYIVVCFLFIIFPNRM